MKNVCSQLVDALLITPRFSTKAKMSTTCEQLMNRLMNTFSTCPHFTLCSGCVLDRNFFDPPVKKAIEALFQKQKAPLCFHSDGFASTRWKAKLAIRGSASHPQIGLFKKHSHEVVPVPECQVHHPRINESVESLRKAIIQHQISPYSENPPQGTLRYAQFFVERATARVQLVLVVHLDQMDPELQALCDTLAQEALWHSIWINFNTQATNRIFSDSWFLFSGEPWLWQHFSHTPVAFHPGAFSQAHLPLFEKALETIEFWIPEGATLLELFAGTGAISLFVQKKCTTIDLIENNPLSALSFRESLKKLSNAAKFSYHLRDVEGPFDSYDVIFVDPPRKGLGALLLQSLKQNQSPNLIYMSCDFKSFQRDAEGLIAGGWKLKKGEGFSFFPGTDEMEILALFQR